MADPLPICHLEGALLPLREARISPLDRGFLYGDGIYEVIAAPRGRVPRLPAHLARLERSLAAVAIRNPHSSERWRQLIEELLTANGGGDLYVYLQVSRGAEYGRNHAPPPGLVPTVFMFCAPLPQPSAQQLAQGLHCITAPDIRWSRCDVKSVSLLANVLLRMQAADAGAPEAILLRDGWLTEAAGAAVHVVIGGEIRTPPRSHQLLPGTTRGFVEELAAAHGIPCRSESVSEAQLRSADEVWLSAAVRGVAAVTRLDGKPVGNGKPGPLWQRVNALLSADGT